ncbi:VOC family protein [Novosphingobium sp.]|uniref:VOC family protein n=1 Tax=Novosphingobium sp. TaxID=1874826 RepID=UPI0025FFB739|nr:VOC family protein [Novosphingobium sp.]
MKTFEFGQAEGQIMQMAYVVEDLEASIEWWSKEARTGPWFVIDHFLAPDQNYRGKPSTADVRIAMSFAGHMNIELIQPLDSKPSVYKELIDTRGYGFHHVGIAFVDMAAAIAEYESRGYTLAYDAAVPTGGSVAYMDDGRNEPGFVELLPVTDGMESTFTRMWRQCNGWDGIDPIRPFA